MRMTAEMPAVSKARQRTGQALSQLAILFLLFDAVAKCVRPLPPPVAAAMAQLGIAPALSLRIGALLLVCTLLYAVPRTAVLGAVLLTGYLGGAVAVHLRAGNPLFGYVLFPVYVGVLVWAALYLQEPRLRALLPLRR